MKILHLSPTYFDPASVIGGAERYAYELAKAMSRHEEVHFVSFGAQKSRSTDGNLIFQRLVLPGLLGLSSEILWADVIHCHQVYRWQTDFAILLGRLLGKKIFASDLGGMGSRSIAYHVPILKGLNGMLLISGYSKQLWQKSLKPSALPKTVEVIWGGVDLKKFRPQPGRRGKKILFVGRILAHKGIDVLLDAVDPAMEVEIVGKPYDEKYLTLLKEKARGKNVRFLFEVQDEELAQKYAEALVTVSPSVYKNCFGEQSAAPELLGLAALESMACATPVIVSRVASLPELVREGETGFVVPERDPEALREKLRFLLDHPGTSEVMGQKGHAEVLRNFTWDITAERCLQVYRQKRESGAAA